MRALLIAPLGWVTAFGSAALISQAFPEPNRVNAKALSRYVSPLQKPAAAWFLRSSDHLPITGSPRPLLSRGMEKAGSMGRPAPAIVNAEKCLPFFPNERKIFRDFVPHRGRFNRPSRRR